jgi:hypothetical protein
VVGAREGGNVCGGGTFKGALAHVDHASVHLHDLMEEQRQQQMMSAKGCVKMAAAKRERERSIRR